MDETINHEVGAVSFGFYTEEEIRSLSVKKITQSLTHDALGRPIPNGLYDLAMGPLEPRTNCETCGLSFKACPGHMGHIELAVPTYQPLLFNLLYKMLRAKCFFCHKIRVPTTMRKKFIVLMKLINAGLFLEAVELLDHAGRVNVSSIIGKGASKNDGKDEGDDEKKADGQTFASVLGTYVVIFFLSFFFSFSCLFVCQTCILGRWGLSWTAQVIHLPQSEKLYAKTILLELNLSMMMKDKCVNLVNSTNLSSFIHIHQQNTTSSSSGMQINRNQLEPRAAPPTRMTFASSAWTLFSSLSLEESVATARPTTPGLGEMDIPKFSSCLSRSNTSVRIACIKSRCRISSMVTKT